MTKPSALCDPEQHGGQEVPAEFILRIRERPMFNPRPRIFACCSQHIAAAYHTMDPTTEETVTLEMVTP